MIEQPFANSVKRRCTTFACSATTVRLPVLGVVDIAVHSAPGALWQATGAGPLDFAAHRALSDLLALELRCERLDRSQQLSGGCVLEVFGDEVKRDTMLLHLLNEDRDVGLLPAQSIEGVGQDDIGLS